MLQFTAHLLNQRDIDGKSQTLFAKAVAQISAAVQGLRRTSCFPSEDPCACRYSLCGSSPSIPWNKTTASYSSLWLKFHENVGHLETFITEHTNLHSYYYLHTTFSFDSPYSKKLFLQYSWLVIQCTVQYHRYG